GTALARTKIIRFHDKGPGFGAREAISDVQTTAADIVSADPQKAEIKAGRRVGEGAKAAYVLDDLTDLTDAPRTSTLADISGNGRG
ncbi:MAG: hypothetical protein WAL84_02270, partial [Candidatus Dormiibacterota bacterium]